MEDEGDLLRDYYAEHGEYPDLIQRLRSKDDLKARVRAFHELILERYEPLERAIGVEYCIMDDHGHIEK
jgi:hypothetical protein